MGSSTTGSTGGRTSGSTSNVSANAWQPTLGLNIPTGYSSTAAQQTGGAESKPSWMTGVWDMPDWGRNASTGQPLSNADLAPKNFDATQLYQQLGMTGNKSPASTLGKMSGGNRQPTRAPQWNGSGSNDAAYTGNGAGYNTDGGFGQLRDAFMDYYSRGKR